jgi:hypothetical protein
MDKKKIEEALLAKATKKGDKLFITCANAFKIAEKQNIALIEIGKICNAKKIKISNCQLGCF